MSDLAFMLDRGSGVPAYRQLEDQVIAALHLGLLHPGDRLPTVAAVVRQVGINANTVLRAYRQLEQRGITLSKPGVGTIVVGGVSAASAAAIDDYADGLERLARRVLEAGLGPEALRQITQAVLERVLVVVGGD